jgi:WD40 repeat protein
MGVNHGLVSVVIFLGLTGQASAGSPGRPEVVVQSGHNHAVMDVAFSPDSGLLATASNDGAVKLWDIRVGREVRTLVGADRPLFAVAISPDGTQVAAGGADKHIFVWNIRDGRRVAILKGHDGHVEDLAFSPDGSLLASAGQDNVAIIWDLERGTPSHFLKHDDFVNRLAWSPDSKTLATRSGSIANLQRSGKRNVLLWDAQSGKELRAFPIPARDFTKDRDFPASINAWGPIDFLCGLGFSSDGKRLGFTVDGTTQVVDPANGTLLRAAPGVFLAFRQEDGALCILPKPGTVRFVAPPTGRDLGGFTAGAGLPNRRSRFNADGRLLACGIDQAKTGIWDTRNGGVVQLLGDRIGVTFGRGGGNMMRPHSVAWSPTAPLFATAETRLVRLVDLRNGPTPRVIHADRGLVSALAFRPDGKVLATAGDETVIKLWDVGDGRLLATLDYAKLAGRAETLLFSPSGKQLVSGHWFGPSDGDSRIIVWDVETRKPIHVLRDQGPARIPERVLAFGGKISGLAILDNQLLTTHHYHNRLSSWDLKTGKQFGSALVSHTCINSLALSPDGRAFAIAGGVHGAHVLAKNQEPDNAIRLFQLFNRKLQEGSGFREFTLKGHTGMVHTVAFSSDGKLLASGSADATVKLWDPVNKALLATLEGHTSDVGSVAFSPDGRILASAGYDQAVCLWDVPHRKRLATFVAFGEAEYVMVTPDNYYAASRQGVNGVAFRLGNRAFPFDQFDLKLNRPDLVLAHIGASPPELVSAFRQAHRARLRKLRITEDMLGDDFHLPTVAVSSKIPLATEDRNLRLKVKADDARYRLDRLNVSVNGVPIRGRTGIDLHDRKTQHLVQEVEVELSAGRNAVRVSALNERGAESLQETAEISYTGPAGKPTLYVVAVGISDYVDERYRLNYADKDARDIAACFENRKERFDQVKVRRLLNRDARRENILQVKDFLKDAGVDDQVILFFAGHGLLDKNLDYYFATADIDFRQPAKRGLSYDAIEGLLDGIRARKKLLLMDTCHAGEVDKEALEVVPAEKVPEGVVKVRSFRGLDFEAAPRLGLANSYQLLQELFADLRRGTGAVVIASAGGTECALESDRWKNGVFTHALLRGLKGEARRGLDVPLRVSELRDFVQREVRRLTGGLQAPTARRENLELDFPID